MKTQEVADRTLRRAGRRRDGRWLCAGCSPGGCPSSSRRQTPPKQRLPKPRLPMPRAKPYIPVISKGFQHQFWQAVKAGSEQAATDLNVDITFEGPESESEVDKQIEMLQAALAKNPAAICLAALDTKAVIPLLEEAKAKGIPVVGFDSGVDSDIPVTTATTDNIAAAALAADKMAELIGGEGKVAVHGPRPDQPHRHRPPRGLCQPDARPSIRTSRSSTSTTARATS